MGEQLIIALGREFGSGGHVIAEKLAEEFHIPLYDKNLLKKVAIEKNVSEEELGKYDEEPRGRILTRKVRGLSNSLSENVANMQFNYLKKMAESGNSFVVVGRCAETVLEGCKGLVSIFVWADEDRRVERIMNRDSISKDEAAVLVRQKDAKRKSYHNDHSKTRWGHARNYDITINSSKLGIDGTADFLVDYIKSRIK